MKTVFVVLLIDPDGDSYSIHKNLQSAEMAFERIMSSGYKPDAFYVLEVEFNKEFGFGAYNEFYGVEKVHRAWDETMVE